MERGGCGEEGGGEDLLAATGSAMGFLCLLSTTSSTASSCDTEFTKEDEQRLKDYIQQLRNDRAAVKLTMLELESIHIDPLSYDVKPRGDSQRLDLENAVLMQELMAMKVSAWGALLRPGSRSLRCHQEEVQKGLSVVVSPAVVSHLSPGQAGPRV